MTDDRKPRHWTLRINSNNDGGGYLYSGDDVSYPKDDYLRVIELEPTLQLIEEMSEALKFYLEIKPFPDDGAHAFLALEDYRKFLEGLK